MGLVQLLFIATLSIAWAQPQRPECKSFWSGAAQTAFQADGPETFRAYLKRVRREECSKEWLVIVYMAADNSLSPYSWRDLWEMEAVGSTVSMDVVVYRDGEERGTEYLYVSKNPKLQDYTARLSKFVKREKLAAFSPEVQEERFLSKEGSSLVLSPRVQRFPEESSASLEVAGRFLRWAVNNFPSRRVLLIGWSHGEGFDSEKNPKAALSSLGKQGGFAFDEHCERNRVCDEHMHVTEMARGLKALTAETRGGRPIDILGSDACLNQQFEFAYEWRGVADYLFGSSTIVQKKGFNYRTLLDRIARKPYGETAELAAEIPKIYASGVNPHNTSRYSSYRDPRATMATWTMAELSRLSLALDDVAKDLVKFLDSAANPLERTERRGLLLKMMGIDGAHEIELGGETLSTPIRLGAVSMDLLNFLQVLGVWMRIERDEANEEEVEIWEKRIATVNSARSVLSRGVLAYHVGPYYQEGLVKTSLGVAIWAPNTSEEFEVMLPLLNRGAFYSESRKRSKQGWAGLMDLLQAD